MTDTLMNIHQAVKLFLFTLASTLLLACAAHKLPPQLADNTERKIEQAKAENAEDNAPAELYEAREFFSQAKEQIEDNNLKTAERLLQKAAVTAEYAIVKSRSVEAKKSAQELEKGIDVLREELETNSGY